MNRVQQSTAEWIERNPKYRIQRLEHLSPNCLGYWRTVGEYRNRDKARQVISSIRGDVIERNGNSIDGPHFLLVKDHVENGLVHDLIID